MLFGLNRLFLFIFLFISASQLVAQPSFERVYGGSLGEQANYLQTTSDSGYVLIGYRLDSVYNTRDYYVLKLDSFGNEQWAKTYGDPNNEYGSSIVTLYNKGYAFIGTHVGIFFDGQAEVVVIDSAGTFVSSNSYPPFEGWGTSGIGILQTPDSNLAMTIYTDGFISQNYYSLVKLNPDLSTDWGNFISYDGSLLNVQDAVLNSDPVFYTLGYYDDYYYSTPDILQASEIQKIGTGGNLISDSVYSLNCVKSSISPVAGGGVALCGSKDTMGSWNLALTKIDVNGNVSWQKQYGTATDEVGVVARQTSDGGYVLLANMTNSLFPYTHDILLLKTNSNGDSLWSRIFGAAGDDVALQLEETIDKGFVILGKTNSFGISNIYVIKTDSLGIIQTPYTITGQGHYWCAGDSVDLDLVPSPDSSSHILWSNGDTTQTIRVLVGGNYYAHITDSSGNDSRSSYYFVYFIPLPDANLGSQDTISICDGGFLQNLVPQDPVFTYTWYLNDTLLPGAVTPNLIPESSGVYKIVVSDYCGLDSAQVFLDTIYPLPAPPILSTAGPATICPGDSMMISVVDTGYFYQWWFIGNSGSAPIQGATDSILVIQNEGSYYMQITAGNSCSAFSSAFYLEIDDDPVYVNASGPISFCLGGQVTLTAAAGTDYLWSTSDTLSSILVTAPGFFSYSMIDTFNCAKYSDTVEVSINPLPIVWLGNDTVICDTSSFMLDAGPGFNNYFWQDASIARTFEVHPPVGVNDSADYFVFVTDTNGCINSDTIRIFSDFCLGTNDLTSDLFTIYPNPVRACSTFYIHGIPFTDCTIYITGLAGNLVFEFSNVNREEMMIPSLGPGLYFLKIMKNNEIFMVKKIIVQ